MYVFFDSMKFNLLLRIIFKNIFTRRIVNFNLRPKLSTDSFVIKWRLKESHRDSKQQ